MPHNDNDTLNLELKILEAYSRDVGRGIARIDYDSMDSIIATTGDIIEIRVDEKSTRKTVAKCLPLYPSDEGKGIIRIDGIVRNNADLAIGDTAHIRKIKVKPAEKVIVAPLEAIPPIDERYLSDSLESVSMTKGDNFMVPYFGGRLLFQVVDLTPATSEAVIISQGTQFIITSPDQALRGADARAVAYEDIGGLKDEIQRVREMIELPLRHPEIF
ncbi:MAG: AAA family ATPase, partial [Nitrososphaeraceae archaeon]|nr:AAA family ATPase [Nitrososphaeraceae archaeon]